MKRPIHFAWTYRVILVPVLTIIGGLAGVYGIHARPNLLRTEISPTENREISPTDPMVVNFPAPVIPGNYEGETKIDPGIAAKVEWKDASQKPGITPEHFWKPEYEVRSSANHTKDADRNYREIHSSSLETLPPKPPGWDGTFLVRIEQAAAYMQPKIVEGKYVDINLSAQILSIFEDGKLLDSYLVSTGKRGMETPRGTHVIANKSLRAWSQKYGLFMPYWMAITPGGSFGIHELPEWPGGCKVGANHLGIPVSHGCVRLGTGPAERVYNWAEIGTPVVVY